MRCVQKNFGKISTCLAPHYHQARGENAWIDSRPTRQSATQTLAGRNLPKDTRSIAGRSMASKKTHRMTTSSQSSRKQRQTSNGDWCAARPRPWSRSSARKANVRRRWPAAVSSSDAQRHHKTASSVKMCLTRSSSFARRTSVDEASRPSRARSALLARIPWPSTMAAS